MLLDECIPQVLKSLLPAHDVSTVVEMGWAGTKNGALLRLATGKFDIFLTIDQNLPYQQNLNKAGIAVVLIEVRDNRISTLRPLLSEIESAIGQAAIGKLTVVKGKPA